MKKILYIGLITLMLSITACGAKKADIDEATQMVIDLIDTIGEVTIDDESVINKSYERYNSLPDAQKELVPNYATLLKAMDELELIKQEALKAQEAEAEETEEQQEEVKKEKIPLEYDDITIDDVTYTFADFDEFNSNASENGHGGELHFTVGTASELKFMYDSYLIELTTANDEVWSIGFGLDKNVKENVLKRTINFENEEIIVYGKYLGFSGTLQMPGLMADGVIVGDDIYKSETWICTEWHETELKGSHTLQEVTFLKPDSWRSKEATKPKGIYYYPYDNILGQVYINYQNHNEGNIKDKTASYKDYISGMVKSKEDILSEEKVKIGGLDGYKACIIIDEPDIGQFEIITYVLFTKKNVYTFMFGEYLTLSSNMENFAEEFMSNVSVEPK